MQTEKEFLSGFEECFGEIEDKRQSAKSVYPLIEILFLTIVAVSAGAFSWQMIEEFGKINIAHLRRYYPFADRIPSDDTIRRLFEMMNPEQLNKALIQYFTKDLDLTGEDVAIDGKSLRGSRRNGVRALHFLNVYASGSGITLFGKAVDSKTNEITAIPEAIDLLDIKGATITIDAMGCQKSIASKIIDKGADYILGLKGNQIALYEEVKALFSTNAEKFFDMEVSKTQDKAHGRIERRTCRIVRDLTKIPSSIDWRNIACVIEIRSEIEVKGTTTISANYYISSSQNSAAQIMKSIRAHWAIESMHWTLDVVFKEDASTMYKGNIPANMAIVRRFVLNILGNMKGNRETRPNLMRKIGWSPEYLHKFIQMLGFDS
jgi:predicted transposase YbfD/YdcC